MTKTAPVKVRTALNADAVACADLFARVQQEIEPHDPPWRAADFDEQVAGEDILVAAIGEEVAGFLSLWRPDGFVHFLHVAPPWRRRGVGRSLLAAARADVQRPLELKCRVGNTRALAFYARLGWRAVSCGDEPRVPYVRLRQGN